MLRFSHVLTKFKTFAALIFEKRALKTQISMNLYAEKSKRTYDLAAGYPLTLSAHFELQWPASAWQAFLAWDARRVQSHLLHFPSR